MHPGEDLHDGTTFEMFLERVGDTSGAISVRPDHFVLQQLDYLEFIDIYHARIKMFMSRTLSSGERTSGVYGGYQPWFHARVGSGHRGRSRWIFVPSFRNLRSTTSWAVRMGMLSEEQ